MKIINWIKENKILLILVFFGSLFRLYKLDYQSLWVDEIITVYTSGSDKSFSEIYQYLINSDPHPPLYYYIVHCFYLIFENSSLVARVVSALFGIGGFFALYHLSKELHNKNVGLIAVCLLALNYFHIFYSQEARMYSMLFFTTTISFYYLIRFIKNPSLKTAIIHGIFASIMIYTHFFALFTLFSQYVILLYFLIKPYDTSYKLQIKLPIISGLTTLLLYIPAIFIFLKTSQRTSIWIPIPDKEVFSSVFKEFFGFCESILVIFYIVLIFYFIKMFNKKENIKYVINPLKDKFSFSFFVISIWIVITIIIPLVLSFVNLPMIVSRYFINILPAILILISLGIYQIKNNVVKTCLITLIILFSITDIIVVKKYYKIPNKAQFREASLTVINNNPKKDKVYTSQKYYFDYYFNLEKSEPTVEKELETLLIEMETDSTKLKSFWFVDAFGKTYNPSANAEAIIAKHFIINKSFDGFQGWAKHFVLIGELPKSIDLTGLNIETPYSGDGFMNNIEIFETVDNKVNISGWAYFDGISSENTKISLVLINEKSELKNIKTIPIQNIVRPDVTAYFKCNFNADNSGFKADYNISSLDESAYKLGIYIENKKESKRGLFISDRIIK